MITALCSADSWATHGDRADPVRRSLPSGVDCRVPDWSVELTLRNRALRRSSMIMLRATVNNHALAGRAVLITSDAATPAIASLDDVFGLGRIPGQAQRVTPQHGGMLA